jgi:hypothetical protein
MLLDIIIAFIMSYNIFIKHRFVVPNLNYPLQRNIPPEFIFDNYPKYIMYTSPPLSIVRVCVHVCAY